MVDIDKPIKIVTNEELDQISGAFGYDSASPHGWACLQLRYMQEFIEEGGVVEIQGTYLPGRLDSLAKFMLWRNEVWGRYLTE